MIIGSEKEIRMFDAKFFAKDFVGGKLPTKVGEIAKVKEFFGQKNAPVRVLTLWNNCVLATLL
jgi:hypothetical protein